MSSRLRSLAIVVHRYVGLALATFLIFAGVTGMVLAFYTELDGALNPELFFVERPSPNAPLLDAFVLRDRLAAQLPEGQKVEGAVLKVEHGRTLNYWIDEHEVFVDPYTGRIVGRRRWGDPSGGKHTFLTFVYRLHFTLGFEDVGRALLGVVALVWTIDCFVGAYITFPPPVRSRPGARSPSWIRRWLGAWSLNTSKLFSLIFSWHRASGLWIWAMLFVFAWSSVALNLWEPVYEPLMSTFFGEAPEPGERIPELPTPRVHPRIGFPEARTIGRRLMAAEAERRGFRVLDELALYYDDHRGVYAYAVESTLDISARLADTHVLFDGDTGRRLGFGAPTGEHAASTFTSWIIALHFGSVREGGLAYRTFVFVMGVGVVLLSVSGVWIWWKKCEGRAKRSGAQGASQQPRSSQPQPEQS